MGQGALVPACGYFQRLVSKERERTWVQAIEGSESWNIGRMPWVGPVWAKILRWETGS